MQSFVRFWLGLFFLSTLESENPARGIATIRFSDNLAQPVLFLVFKVSLAKSKLNLTSISPIASVLPFS